MSSIARDWASPSGRHGRFYARDLPPAQLAIEREALGTAVGARGYTTLEQATRLAAVLGLAPGVRLLDVGAGRGWPGLFLAELSGCEPVLTDLPAAALRAARERARAGQIAHAAVQASATALPFRPATFDAAVSTDVL